jgi:hypothetical protein
LTRSARADTLPPVAVKTQGPDLPYFTDDFSADPKDWVPALLLQADLEKELAEKRLHLLRRLATWLSLITIFRRLEHDKMIVESPTARDYKYHKAMLSFIVGSGEILILELESHKQIDSVNIGMPFESVAATLQELRYDLRMWHSDMTDDRRAQILKDVFGNEK